jgi:light-regulated signal transduction histidine kinase (bacteriophytochrome)
MTDNGIGISPEFAERVFVIFQRLHTRDEYHGNGIGLALCRKIVEYHGGTIAVDTEHTPGTRIVFTLPAAG